MVRCIVQERFATCFFLTPILFALSIMIVSGMVNSFIQVTFLIKVVAALVVYMVEDRWRVEFVFAPIRLLVPRKRHKDMSVSPSTVPGDQYLGGLFMFLYRAIREHLFLTVLLPLVAMAVAYVAALQLPTVYTAQGSIRIGKSGWCGSHEPARCRIPNKFLSVQAARDPGNESSRRRRQSACAI